MIIRRLILSDFRNLHACDLLPGPGINILCGENGQGKTNFLESIYLLSNLSPIRTVPLKDLLLFGADHSRISGEILSRGIVKELSLFLRKGGKVVKVNGKSVSRGVDYFGELAVVLFSPDTLRLVWGGPDHRRRFLDRAISRLDRRYLLDLKEYNRILEQRNRLLRLVRQGRAANKVLTVWNEQFASTASRILHRRFSFLSDLAPICSDVFRDLFRKRAPLRIFYCSSLFRRSRMEGAAMDAPHLRRSLVEGMARLEGREIGRGATQLGPHLDDVNFLIGDHSVKSFASQGEKRLLALSLILSEAMLYRRNRDLSPVLLLDDMNSELDPGHRQILIDALRGVGQVFLTTTEDGPYEKTDPLLRCFRVSGGEIVLEKSRGKM